MPSAGPRPPPCRSAQQLGWFRVSAEKISGIRFRLPLRVRTRLSYTGCFFQGSEESVEKAFWKWMGLWALDGLVIRESKATAVADAEK